MKGKRRRRLVEWGKSLLIVLLALSALYQLGRAQSFDGLDIFRELWNAVPTPADAALPNQSGSSVVYPVRLAVCQDGNRYGVQYDQAGTDAAFSSFSILLSEALSSAGAPQPISEQEWRGALCRTGIYLEFLYPVSLRTLSSCLGDSQSGSELTGLVRRVCLSANQDGGVALYYINEEDSSYYSCGTTLSRQFHLDSAVDSWSPNGALFAFEVPDMEALAPYTLLTSAPQPVVYAAGSPLLEDGSRVTELLEALSFHPRGSVPDPAVGGQMVEGNDSLRLYRGGLVTFHAIGSSDVRFPLAENSTQGALDCTQALAEAAVGAWCGQARLCLAGVEENADGWVITFQYSLNGSPVALPEDAPAAQFTVRNGAVTDFSLYLRTYSNTGEVFPVLPEALAAAAMEARNAQGKELTLLYEDAGGDQVRAGWIAGTY